MKVLAIGAHPDDIELICAGTMAKFKQQGAEVFLCHVCDGNKAVSYTHLDVYKRQILLPHKQKWIT